MSVVLGPAEAGEDDAWRTVGRVLRPESVAELAGILAGARAFVGNDSGPSHVAAALGVAGVVLYVETDPADFGPRGASVHAIDARSGAGRGTMLERAWASLAAQLP